MPSARGAQRWSESLGLEPSYLESPGGPLQEQQAL